MFHVKFVLFLVGIASCCDVFAGRRDSLQDRTYTSVGEKDYIAAAILLKITVYENKKKEDLASNQTIVQLRQEISDYDKLMQVQQVNQQRQEDRYLLLTKLHVVVPGSSSGNVYRDGLSVSPTNSSESQSPRSVSHSPTPKNSLGNQSPFRHIERVDSGKSIVLIFKDDCM